MKKSIATLLILMMVVLPICPYAAYAETNYVVGKYDFDLDQGSGNTDEIYENKIQLAKQSQVNEMDGQYKGEYYFYRGVAKFRTLINGAVKYGLVDVNGKVLGKLYDGILDFSEGLAFAYTDNGDNKIYECLRTDGSVAFALNQHMTASAPFNSGLARVAIRNLSGGV